MRIRRITEALRLSAGSTSAATTAPPVQLPASRDRERHRRRDCSAQRQGRHPPPEAAALELHVGGKPPPCVCYAATGPALVPAIAPGADSTLARLNAVALGSAPVLPGPPTAAGHHTPRALARRIAAHRPPQRPLTETRRFCSDARQAPSRRRNCDEPRAAAGDPGDRHGRPNRGRSAPFTTTSAIPPRVGEGQIGPAGRQRQAGHARR
jgi:hypothetical protein